ncbi:S9 family peptidase [Photobacterium sp. 1_MG-2023]|uniref:alpha/beta hydrolase family protein n=1 Tax=Photobacterium sp. 1_MG-2023 TaxID=3062646 RepID=UPI0026E140AD|nr:alpha/beta hydrolase [Photobacterium sp. 1_MG-2023]MDO6708390.1 alpha/beta hydrolase [Photobacterium sp. 1_MG-2023]
MNTLKILLLFFACLVSGCFSEEKITFQSGENRLSGVFLHPTNHQPSKAVLLFVHGDGAMPFDAEGYYPLIWDQLRAEGYSILSWDKPGIGASTGNWLDQSMTDRQNEVLAAIQWVQSRYHFTPQTTGIIGFSQAGWILPALATHAKAHIGFMVGIGFATNWIEQSRYYTRIQQEEAGASAADIQAALSAYDQEIALLHQRPSYADYRKIMGNDAMPEARYSFVLKNLDADAKADYERLEIPTLLMWGEHDLNVDAALEYQRQQHLSNMSVTATLIPFANHGLLHTHHFPRQKMDFWDLLKLHWLGQAAFAPAALDTLTDWLNQQTFGARQVSWLNLLNVPSRLTAGRFSTTPASVLSESLQQEIP